MVPPKPVAGLLALILLAPLSGCALEDPAPAPPLATSWVTGTPPPAGEPVRVTFGGQVLDALSGEAVDDAQVVLVLASEAPCQRESIAWNDYLLPLDAEGRFGPFQVDAPNSPDYRFWVHVDAAGYTSEALYVGPRQAPLAGNMSIVLHPRVAVEGSAPAGTIVALAAPKFPRFEVANATGAFRFDDARVTQTQLVAATPNPERFDLTPPTNDIVVISNGTGWAMQGVVKREDGRPIGAKVVAWAGTTLWSAAVTDEVGRFLLPLPPTQAALTIEARTGDDQFGGTLAREVNGPPSTVETVIVRARC